MTISAILLMIVFLWLLKPASEKIDAMIVTNPASQQQPVATQVASMGEVMRNSPAVTPRSQQQSPPIPATTFDEQSVVAQINNATVTLDELIARATLDQAIQQFLGQSSQGQTGQVELDRLINSELVNQAAILANFYVATDEYEQALTYWLASHQQTEAALETTLKLNGFTLDDFANHFRYLLTIDRFMAEQSRVYGTNRNALLQEWQQSAKISFGPAANLYLSSTGATEDSVTPSSNIPAVQSVGKASGTVGEPTKLGPFTLWQNEKTVPSENGAIGALSSADATISTVVMGDVVVMDTRVFTEQGTSPENTVTETTLVRPVGLAPGNRAPTFTLALLDEENSAINLSAWQGKPIVLSFWTTWCPYCRKQTPILVDAALATAPENIQFIGINVNEAVATARAYVEKHQIPYPILLDHDGAVTNRYAVRGYPTTYFIDANGLIVTKHVGALNESQLTRYLAQLQP